MYAMLSPWGEKKGDQVFRDPGIARCSRLDSCRSSSSPCRLELTKVRPSGEMIGPSSASSYSSSNSSVMRLVPAAGPSRRSQAHAASASDNAVTSVMAASGARVRRETRDEGREDEGAAGSAYPVAPSAAPKASAVG